VVRLPPYSSDFAPVEMVSSKVEAKLAEIFTPHDLEAESRFALHIACLSVFPQDCHGYFDACHDHMMAVLPKLTGPEATIEGLLNGAPVPMDPW